VLMSKPALVNRFIDGVNRYSADTACSNGRITSLLTNVIFSNFHVYFGDGG
jgi:hypothetical protein